MILVALNGFAKKKQLLFNGKNLKGWTITVSDPTINPDQFFYVKDGVIETIGIPNGYLRTQKEFTNYQLHIEWCYPEKPTNSGIFLHTTGPDQIWPKHYQCQLKDANAGDFIVNALAEKATVGDSICLGTETVKPLIAKMNKSNEKPAGKWNGLDIKCKGDVIEIWVNGELQNRATNCSMTKGSIGLQAEGSKIRFRNIWIEKLK
jgi:hypothetical protein